MTSSPFPDAPVPLPSAAPPDIDATLARHRRDAEVLVGWIQLAIVLVFGVFYAVAPKTSAMGTAVQPVPVALSIYLFLTLGRLHLAYRDRLTPLLLYLSILLDVLVLYGLIFSYHLQYDQPPAFYLKAPTLLYVFIFISLRSLRLEPHHVLVSGVMGTVGWMALAAYAAMAPVDMPVTRDYVAYMTEARILIGAEVDKILSIIAVTGILYVGVRRGRALLVGQAGLARDNATLYAGTLSLNRDLAAEVTQRRAAQEALREAAYVDPLTGLGNRTWFLEQLPVLTGAVRAEAPMALLHVDIDRFRAINDALGYDLGDAVLCRTADILRALAGSTGAVSRLGGDDFALVLPADETAALGLARRIQHALGAMEALPGRSVELTASVGVLVMVRPDPCREVLRDADVALGRAQKAGRGRIVLFDPAMRDEVNERLALEVDLRGALARGELALHYQPIVRLTDRRLAGFEALMRWTHPARGPVSPGAFIPVAEDTGLIVELGAWALDEAARFRRGLVDAGADPDLFVSVNVSARQMAEPDRLLRAATEALGGKGRLKLEVTESLLVDDPERAQRTLRHLAGLGAKLAIDDFGTGYSSLAQLNRFPFDTLKIDKSFVDGLVDGSTRAIVEATINLAGGLGSALIAEGVETEEQAALLLRLGCQHGQGWLFGRPQPGEKARLLATA